MLFESIVFFFHKINQIDLLRVKKILGALGAVGSSQIFTDFQGAEKQIR